MDQGTSGNPRQYLASLAKWWWLLLITSAVAAVSSYFISQTLPKTYQARTVLLVGPGVGASTNSAVPSGSSGNAADIAAGYATIAVREPVLKATLDAFKLDWDVNQFKTSVSANVIGNTGLLEIVVLDTDPQRVRLLSEEIANQLIQLSPSKNDEKIQKDRAIIRGQIADLNSKIDAAKTAMDGLNAKLDSVKSALDREVLLGSIKTLDGQITQWQGTMASLYTNLGTELPNALSIIEHATVPVSPVSPRIMQNVLLAGIVGLLLSSIATLAIEALDDTVKNTEDVRQSVGEAPIAAIPRIETGSGHSEKLVVSKFPLSSAAEAYRILRTNLQFKMVANSYRTIMVTSTQPMEGKSVTAANLAAVIAQSGKRVILVDADLRRPTVHRVFDLSNSVGLTGALLEERANLDDFVRTDVLDNLSILTSGPLPPNPSELLGSARMGALIKQLEARADIVIFDTPPVMSVADASILATVVEGVLLVVDSGNTRRKAARASMDALQSVGGKVIGVLLNRVSRPGKDASYTYYYPQRKDPEPASAKGKSKGLGFGRRDPKPAMAKTVSAGDSASADAGAKSSRRVIERQSS